MCILDPDPCLNDNHDCDDYANCTTTSIGNYTCKCFDGFEGDGFSCEGTLVGRCYAVLEFVCMNLKYFD